MTIEPQHIIADLLASAILYDRHRTNIAFALIKDGKFDQLYLWEREGLGYLLAEKKAGRCATMSLWIYSCFEKLEEIGVGVEDLMILVGEEK